MKTFYAELITPDKIFYKGEISALSVTLNDGAIEILAGHMPAVCELSPGKCVIKLADGTERIFGSNDGILNIKKDCVIVTSDFLEWEENIESAVAELEKRTEIERKRRKESFVEHQLGIYTLKRLCANLSKNKEINK